jgi:hypothetical protein
MLEGIVDPDNKRNLIKEITRDVENRVRQPNNNDICIYEASINSIASKLIEFEKNGRKVNINYILVLSQINSKEEIDSSEFESFENSSIFSNSTYSLNLFGALVAKYQNQPPEDCHHCGGSRLQPIMTDGHLDGGVEGYTPCIHCSGNPEEMSLYAVIQEIKNS